MYPHVTELYPQPYPSSAEWSAVNTEYWYLKVAWDSVAVFSTPKNLYQLRIRNGDLAAHAERIVDVQFLFPSVVDHVFRQCRNVAQTLQSAMESE